MEHTIRILVFLSPMTQARGLSTNQHGIVPKTMMILLNRFRAHLLLFSHKWNPQVLPRGFACLDYGPVLPVSLVEKVNKWCSGKLKTSSFRNGPRLQPRLVRTPKFQVLYRICELQFFRLFNYAFQWPHDVSDFPITMDECQIFSDTTLVI